MVDTNGSKSEPLTFGSLFSGIGGIDLGFERAGLRCLWQCEIDPYCNKVLETHWPTVERFGDIRSLGAVIPRADVLVGGFPCQPVSLAGKRGGNQDERWLWPEFARLIGLLRPTYVVGENVRGLCSKGLEEVLADLTRLGYDAEWQLVSAASIGAPHIRERLFVVAYPSGARWRGRGRVWPAPSPLEPEGCNEKQGRKWSPESRPIGVAHGVPHRMDRLRALGNSVVPQVAEYVGRLIVEHHQST